VGRDAGLGDRAPAILHVDMDAFFAAVEVLDDPTLVGRPVIVGGTGRRGVVASCTYEARAYGVHSAMPTAQARRLCPHAVFVGGHFSRYEAVSRQLRSELLAVTPLVEPVGLDEAFLDVTGAVQLHGAPRRIADDLRERIQDRLSLTCSVGVGTSKTVAKLASRAAKPVASRDGVRPGAGVVVVEVGDELAFLRPLPIRALWGIGPATADGLARLGVRTVADLAAVPEATLVRRFGQAQGATIAALARGEDPRAVIADRRAKSVGNEETFGRDLFERAELGARLGRMAEAIGAHLRGSRLCGRTVTLKVRFGDFTTLTRAHSLPVPIDTAAALNAVGAALLDSIDLDQGVRLLGLSVSGLSDAALPRQQSFDLESTSTNAAGSPEPDGQRHRLEEVGHRAQRLQASWEDVTAAVDAIRLRFGRQSVGTAAMVDARGVQVPQRRESPWGPADDR
jgi:DNA polymerase-4